MSAQILCNKLKRALRNGTGTSFSAEELQRLADMGLLETLNEAEAEELRAKWADNQNIPLATTGSPRGRMGAPRTGKSAGMTPAQRQRAALALVANG